ncbi:MAG: AEC family transporter [Clostridiales bacterium]|nr:AEC family transporter [Candidatus Crickella merdequi]
MAVIVSKVLVVFIYILIGFAAYRLHVLNDESIKHLTTFIIYITCPALLLSSVGGAELNRSIMFNTLFMLFITLAFFFISSVIALYIARRIKGIDPLDANVHALGMTTVNSGFMGFPITQSVFGPLAFYYIVIQNISLNLYLYTIGVWQVNYKTGTLGSKKSLKEAIEPFINPIIVSAFISTFLLFAGIKIPDYFMNIITTIGDATIPTSMILVGLQLGTSRISSVIKSKYIMFTTFVNLVLFPALAFGIASLLPIDNIVKLAFTLSVCFPSAAIGVAICANYDKNSQLYAEIVAATTLLSMVSLPVWIIIMNMAFPI